MNRAERRRQIRTVAKTGRSPHLDIRRDEKFSHGDDLVVPPEPLPTTLNVGVTTHEGQVYVLGEVQTPAGKSWIMLAPDDAAAFAEEWSGMAAVARSAQAKRAV